jgi:hypothetical protein
LIPDSTLSDVAAPLFNLHRYSPDPLFSTTFQVCFAHLEDDQQANWGRHHSSSCLHLVQMYAVKLT